MLEVGGQWYVLLAVSLSFATFGFNGVLFAVLCVLLFTAGFFAQLIRYAAREARVLSQEFDAIEYKSVLASRLEACLNDDVTPVERSPQITGFVKVDYQLNEVMDLIIQDFVESWYAGMTIDKEFTRLLRCRFVDVLRKFSKYITSIDWIVLLTRDVVDDFATHIRLYRRAKERCAKMAELAGGVASSNIEKMFFELEKELEGGFDRSLVSTSQRYEKDYLLSVSSILSYLLLPAGEFSSKLSRFLIRDILAAEVIGQTVDLLSDPDYVVQLLLWLLSDVPLKYEEFLTILETCESTEELSATIEILQKEIDLQRSKDIGGTNDRTVKQQLSSLYFLKKLIADRLNALQTSGAAIDESDASWSECANLYDLSLTFVLCNNVALCHFIDFLCRTDGKHYIDLFLTIEGFKTSFGQQPTSGSGVLPPQNVPFGRRKDQSVSTAREVALELYQQYFSEEACQVIDISDAMKKRLLTSIQQRYDVNQWFDEVQKKIFDILENDLRFYPAFKRSYAYVKLLAELRLLPTVVEKMDSAFCPSEEALDTESLRSSESGNSAETPAINYVQECPDRPEDHEYRAIITTIGIGSVQSCVFAVYHVSVQKLNNRHECVLQWTVNRRYSDFYHFNNTVKQRFPSLAKLSFPAKKAFNNLSYDFLEKRKRALESYLRMLLNPDLLKKYAGLEEVVLDFLSRKKLLNESTSLTDKITSVVEPIRTGVKSIGNAVIAMPDTLFDGVIRVSDGIGKVTKSVLGVHSAQKVNGEGRTRGRVADLLNVERSDEVPFRILLLCVDEIFGLHEKSQWIRRRIVEFLRQFVHAAFGSSFNKRIVEFVLWLTSEEQVASYIKYFRNTYWPNGTFTSYTPPRPVNAQLRSRLIVKGKLLTFVPDELKLFIGNETTREGIYLFFEALQNSTLNRRLCYVLLERFLRNAFPQNLLEKVIPKLHSKSS